MVLDDVIDDKGWFTLCTEGVLHASINLRTKVEKKTVLYRVFHYLVVLPESYFELSIILIRT